MRAMRSFKNRYRLPVIGLQFEKLSTVSCQLRTRKIIYAIAHAVMAIILLIAPATASAELLRTGQRTCYDQDGNIVDHTGTGQDGDLQSGKIWPEPRFQDNGDGTITDLATGLMWLKDGSCMGWLSWQAAMDAAGRLNSMDSGEEHCSKLSAAYRDWDVPTIQELETLLNSESTEPFRFLNFYGFRGIQADSYWSSTTGPNPYNAWLLHFDTGEIMSGGKVETHHVLFVRRKNIETAEGSLGFSGSGPRETDLSDEIRYHLVEHLSLLRDKISFWGKEQAEPPAEISEEVDASVSRSHLFEHLSLLREKIAFWDDEKVEMPTEVSTETMEETGTPVGPSRFYDNGDGTFTDVETGLMWLKDAVCIESSSWQAGLDAVRNFNNDALSFGCSDFTASGYNDWAVPNRNELRSLISNSSDLPALAPGFPVTSVQAYYWTSTTVAAYPALAYDVYMGTGALVIRPKTEKRNIWPVRPVNGRIDTTRLPDKTQTVELKADHFLLRPIGNRIMTEWPVKQFTDHGDGTIIDNRTGLMWLKDASCLDRYSWKEAFIIIRWLNELSRKIKCEEYTASYEDWQLPEMNQLEILMDSVQGEPAEWFNLNGTLNMQARDYWSSTENPLNLYHAWSLNMLTGRSRNYPKSFKIHVWPFRKHRVAGPVNPVVNVMINGEQDRVLLARGQELTLSVSVDYNMGAVPSNFKVCYDAPDGTAWCLTRNGHWDQEDKILYRGNIFDLDDYTLFHAGTSNLVPGNYTFHFSIAPILDKEAPPIVFSKDIVLMLEEVASTEDEIDEEVIILLE